MAEFPMIPKSNINQIASNIEAMKLYILNQENISSELNAFLMREIETLTRLIKEEKQRTETLSNLAQLLANRI
ncbi:hypothetical protein [Bacillus smithii]|uniref:hypothetical protein n=1 Tax=Bacillus smithii TaxID=1479 RepID=UPI003D1CCF2C